MSMLGIDISNWQANLWLKHAKAAGVKAVIIKATEGTEYVDPYCNDHVKDAMDNGLLIGLYHFARRGNAVAQADHFVESVRGYIGKAVLCLDWEGNAVDQGAEWAKEFCDRVFSLTGVNPIIYMNSSDAARFDYTAIYKRCALWLANYRHNYVNRITEPGEPPHTPGRPVLFGWQYSSQFRIDGYDGDLDVNEFYVDAETWMKYARGPKGVTGNSPAPKNNIRPLIEMGDESAAVREMQQRLRDNFHYAADLDVDGYWGAHTERVVREFQSRAGLEVDGVFGPASWNALISMT